MSDPPPRPKFRTGFGWTFLILAAWNTAVTAMVFVGMTLFGQLGGGCPFDLAATEAARQGLPPTAGFMMGYAGVEMALSILAGLFTTLAAFRLLQLREWARRAILGILILMILMTLFKLGLGLSMQPFVLKQLAYDSGVWGSMWARFQWVATGLSLLQSLFVVALLGWCIHKLRAPEIMRAFRPGW